METTGTQLQRHEIRRAGGIPLPTVFVGAVVDAEAAWWEVCRRRGQTPIRIDNLLAPGLAGLCFEMASSHHGAYAAFADWIAARSCRSSDEIIAVLERGGPGERRLLARQAGLGQAESAMARWARATLLEESVATVFQQSEGSKATVEPFSNLVHALTTLFGASSIPAFLVCAPEDEDREVDWLAKQLEHGERILSASPELALALAISPELGQRFLATGPECREKALLRAGQTFTGAAPGRAPALLDGFALQRTRRYVEELETAPEEKKLRRALRQALQAYGQTLSAEARIYERARSRQEALLFAALEAHPRTRGRFMLNAMAATPDPAMPELEVDFTCAGLKIALEVDGYHHFQAPERYRRDRQRDVALQQAGYVVERFLAEDVAPRLEWIMNRVIRLMDWREKGK